MNDGLAEHLQYHRSLTGINLHHHLQTKLEIKKGFMSTCSVKALNRVSTITMRNQIPEPFLPNAPGLTEYVGFQPRTVTVGGVPLPRGGEGGPPVKYCARSILRRTK